jgi:hypothetical protein
MSLSIQDPGNKDHMEKANRRLAPHFIQSFFTAAFAHLAERW